MVARPRDGGQLYSHAFDHALGIVGFDGDRLGKGINPQVDAIGEVGVQMHVTSTPLQQEHRRDLPIAVVGRELDPAVLDVDVDVRNVELHGVEQDKLRVGTQVAPTRRSQQQFLRQHGHRHCGWSVEHPARSAVPLLVGIGSGYSSASSSVGGFARLRMKMSSSPRMSIATICCASPTNTIPAA